MNKELQAIVEQARAALGPNLLSVVLYGSHARDDAGAHSDVNLLFIVQDYSTDRISPLTKLVPAWQKKRIAPPVILQQDQIVRSLDTFALEFLEMSAARRILFGEDPFRAFVPDWAAVRRDLEHEARQKRIALTRRWLAAGGNAKALRGLIAETVPTYFTLLRATVILKKREPFALTTDAVFTELASKPWFRQDVWTRLRAVLTGRSQITDAELQTLITDYIQQAAALAKRLDELE